MRNTALISGLGLLFMLWGSAASGQKAPADEDAPRPALKGAGDPALVKAISAILADEALEGAKVGLVVDRLTFRGSTRLYGLNPGTRLHPASNTKLVTTAAALVVLGSEFTWPTHLAADTFKDGVADTLYLIGYGDPRFVNEDLWALVDAARLKGLTEVKGDLIVDDTRFSDRRLAPGFEEKNQDAAYRAASGAMSVNFNSTVIQVFPGKEAGDAPIVRLLPETPYARVENEATTVNRGRTRIQVSAKPHKDTTLIRVTGRIPKNHPGISARRRIDNPPRFAGEAARLFLDRAGIKVAGEVKVGPAPRKRKVIARVNTRPLAQQIADVNKLSNNFMAEQMLRTLGAERGAGGTWQAGTRVVRRFLRDQMGLEGRFTYVNGSGLFGDTAFSATQMVKLLTSMHHQRPPLPEYAASLAVSGVDGTLARRMRDLPPGSVRAKTGTLDGVVCLSGYVTLGDGSLGVFSFMINDLAAPAWKAWDIQDEVMRALARWRPKKAAKRGR